MRTRWIRFLVLCLLPFTLIFTASCSTSPQATDPSSEPPPDTEESSPSEEAGASEEPPEVANYPERNVTLVIPWPPGGRTDTYVRIFGSKLEEKLGVPVVPANHSGGAGTVGARVVETAAPDGYTILNLTAGIFFAQFTREPPLDLANKYTPIAQHTVQAPFMLAASPDAPFSTLAEFIEYGQEHPGEIRMANAGTGASDHIYGAAFLREVGVEVTWVPYEGDAPAMAATERGEVDAQFPTLTAALPFLDTIQVLGVASEEPPPTHPDLPTMKSQGVDFTAAAFDGIYGPAGMHPAIVAKLNDAIERVVADEEFQQQMEDLGIQAAFLPSDEFAAKVQEWNPVWEEIVEELGLKP